MRRGAGARHARRRRAPASFLVVAFAVGGCERAPQGSPPATSAKRETAAPAAAAAFPVTFTDVTAAAGLRFEHATGAQGEKLLPETLGSGAAFLDFDGDGRLDIFLVNAGRWPEGPAPDPSPACALYRGRGDGTFKDVSETAGAARSLYGMGCTVADYDGDGDDDIYVTAVGDNVLLRNDGASFRDVTREAGVAGGRWIDRQGHAHPEWSTAAAWFDCDRDGDLDLFVANYVKWSPAHEIFTTLDGVNKAFTTPDRYDGLPPRLYRNRGDGTFEDVSTIAFGEAPAGKSLGVALWDFNRDGTLDLAVANDTRPNFLFLSEDGSRFVERGITLGIGYDETGRARAGMGIAIADCGNDDTPLVAIGNFSAEPMSLYRWRPEGAFDAVAGRAGLATATYRPLAFGVLFADLDLDGAQDLVVANGHIEPDIARTRPEESFAQSPQIFRGRGDGTFEEVSRQAGPEFGQQRVGRGLCAGDVDGDGDLDLLVTTNGGRPSLLRNDLAAARHFLRVRLRGAGANTGALGATVRVEAGGSTQTRLATTGSSYLSQSEPTLTFGLGATARVERVEVRWHDGTTTTLASPEVDTTLVVGPPPPRAAAAGSATPPEEEARD